MEENQSQNIGNVDKKLLWYVDNYVLLKDYYDRTISRIAARCIRKGNIAIEEYPFYGYILDVLEEISETGDLILSHKELHPYAEKKIAGGIATLKKEMNEFRDELRRNSSPDMIKQDDNELEKMKKALGAIGSEDDPTKGAGMNIDEVVEKLMKDNNLEDNSARFGDDGKQIELKDNRVQPQKNQAAPAQKKAEN